MDRGQEAVGPLLEEIIECSKVHKLMLGMGGGTRARHAYAIALDLGMPTSVVAKVGVTVPGQNARIMQMLLSQHGGIMIDHDDFPKLPLYYKLGCIPILPGMPPYEHWEKPNRGTRLPANRTDSGVFLTAEILGSKACIFVKDEKGLYTKNPKTSTDGTFIPKISVQELLDKDLDDLIIERIVLENMLNAKAVKEIQIINGLERGNLTKALNGEHVGTIIYVD
jgi:molybdenum storage protein